MIKSKKYYTCSNEKNCDNTIDKLTSALVFKNKYIVCDKWCLGELLIDLKLLQFASDWEKNNVMEVTGND